MKTFICCLLLLCVGLSHSLELIPQTWLHEEYFQTGRHVRQTFSSTVCDECSAITRIENLFEAFCISPGFIQDLIDLYAHCNNTAKSAHLCAQREDGSFCSLLGFFNISLIFEVNL